MKNFYAFIVCLLVVLSSNGQTVFNLNDASLTFPQELSEAQRQANSWFDDGVRVRPFLLNSQIRNHQNLQAGNEIALQLFNDVTHQATVLRKTTDINGVTAVTLKLNGYQYAYAYIALSPDSYLVTVDIPEENEKYSSRSGINQSQAYMFQLDETILQNLGCGLEDAHNQDSDEEQIPQIPGTPGGNIQTPGAPIEGPGTTPMNESCITMPDINDPAVINMLLVYTPAAENWSNNNEGSILNTLATTLANINTIANNNNLGITFQLVHSELVIYTEAGSGIDLGRLRNPSDGYMDEVHSLRSTYQADLVSLLSYFPGDGIGGIASLLTSKYGNALTGFSLTKVDIASWSYTFAHEVGHNMGAMHNLYQDSDPGPTVWSDWPENGWSAGWRWQGSDTFYYADLMSYTGLSEYPDGQSTTRIPYFSDPDHTHMGGAAGHPTLADNARTLKEVKHYIARYDESLPYCVASVSSPSAVYITQVTMGDINQSSSFSVYSDYSSLASCMQAGDSQLLTVTVPNGISSSRLKVWVDWNDDFDFDEVNELAYASTAGGTSFSASITAPLGVATGSKRMRIRLYDISNGTQNETPCGSASFGEVEDYTINLEASVPCTEAGIPQNLTFESATNSTATISWDALSGIDHYELRYRETGATEWETISPIWYPYHTINDLTFETSYEAQVRSVCDGTTGSYSSSLLFETAGYCASQGGSNWNITNVTFSNINNNSSAGNPSDGYSDFTNITGNVSQLFSYDISITGTGLPENIKSYRVWIDYNQNGEFEIAELVLDQQTNSFNVFGNVTIPVDAILGNTRMRVSYTPNIMSQSPCDIFGFGEVEDYTINILEFVPCETAAAPDNFSLTSMSDTEATLGWDSQSGASFEMRYREQGAPDWTDIPGTYNNSMTLEALSPATVYEAQVRSKCDEFTYSDYTPSLVFETFATPPAYCSAGATNTSSSFEKIANISFNTINNNSTSTAGYEDFTHISTTVEKGETYAFSSTISNIWATDQIIVWIDFNQNGDFTDSGEEVLVINNTAGNPMTGSILIDQLALNGPTRMRVRLHDANDGPNATPCGNSTYGQVEDYILIINPQGFVFQNGSWSPEDPVGVSTVNDNIHVINGSTMLSDNLLANNLFISEGATLSTANTITLNGNIDNEGLLLFQSNDTATGQLDTFTGNITGSGLVTVERYIPARRAFRFLSSAVNTTSPINANWQEGATNATHNTNPGFGTHITGSQTGENGFDATPSGNPSLFTLNNIGQTWEAVDNTDLNTIAAGTAYRMLVRGDRSIDVTSNSATPTNTTLRTTGTLHTGEFIVPDLSGNENSFNFIGNPYPAAVNMNEVLNAATNINTVHYWVWDPTLGGTPIPGQPGGRGAYVAINVGDNTSNNPSSQANRYLQPGQAAFVQTMSNGSASIAFQEQHKAVDQPQTQVFNITSTVRLNLYDANSFATGTTASDGLLLKFSESGTNALTLEDAMKFYNQDENLASVNNETLLSIESRAFPQVGETIPLFTNQYRKTNYMFEATLSEMNEILVFLKDHYTGTLTELFNNETSLYAFQVDPAITESMADDRFEIVFEEMLSSDEVRFGDGFVLFPNPTNGSFNIATRHIQGDTVNLTVSSITGQKVYSNTLTVPSNGQLVIEIPGLAAGLYMVELVHPQGGLFTSKLVKK